MTPLTIALVAGGTSKEREVSLKTGEKIKEALQEKHRVVCYDPKTDLKQFWEDALKSRFDLVFPALHGPSGEDGKFQGMLEMLNLPFVFSGTMASALAMDKYRSKILAKEKGVPTPEDIILDRTSWKKNNPLSKLDLPLIIKPAELGSSVGITVAENEQELERGMEEALEHGDKILIEEYVKGRELTVTVLGNGPAQALPVIEIKPKKATWFDYTSKYEPGATEEICPADIPKDISDKIQDQALKVFEVIGCRDLARVDFIWSEEKEKIFFLEINTIPGMTQTSLVPQAAQAEGLSFQELMEELIKIAVRRREENR